MKITKKIISAFLALSLITGISIPVSNASFNNEISSISEKSTADINAVASEVRKHFVNRENEFVVDIPFELLEDVSNIKKIMSLAVKDTDESSPVEGDYLAWTTGKSSFSFVPDMSTGCYKTTFTMKYRTTAEQEAELDEKVAEILNELDVYSASDYEKIKAVHDYVLQNTEYNLYGDEYIYSAYGACINGEAVCQGYSLIMYRLLSELGINTRIIPGTAGGGDHMWNLVELYGKYYYIDATFDDGDGVYKYAYFLKGSEDFDSYGLTSDSHVFDASNFTSSLYADYSDGDFLARFDISPTAFDPSAPVVTTATTTTTTTTTEITEEYEYGDLNHDGKISVADLVYCSNYVLAVENAEYSCDLNNDNRTDVFDVIIMRQIISDIILNQIN